MQAVLASGLLFSKLFDRLLVVGLKAQCLKFIYSEKATKFREISTLLLSLCTVDESKVEILQTFVAFSEYTNFNRKIPIAEIAQNNPLRSNREQHNIATGITTTCHIFSEGALLFLDRLFSQDKKKSNFYNFKESLIQDIL